MNKLFILLGKTCSGKDTIYQELETKLPPVLKRLQSNTTRPIRDGEIQGKEYNFTTLKEFDSLYKKEEIAEYAIYNTKNGFWCYFTKQGDLAELDTTNLIAIKNPIGYRQLMGSKYKDNIVTIMIDCPEDIIRERYIKRGALDDSIDDRLKRDEKDFRHLLTDYTVLNDGNRSVYEVAEDVLNIIREELNEA